LLAGPLVLVLIVGWFVGLGRFDDGQAAVPQPPTGSLIPQFSLPPLAASDQGLADGDLRGKVAIVNFWASWCLPCREEMPLLRGLAATPGVVVFGINSSDRPVAARQFLKIAGDPFNRIGIDADGAVAKAWGAYGLPATFVIDAEGRVAHALIGPLDRRALDRDILPLIATLSQAP
jgi:cytochrome c biogenesis protein CcmG/thiol:disulfide interchange protein DsbE